MSEEPAVKKFLYLNRKAPHGTIYALEVLEMILISAMFDQDVHVAFLDDGVFQLKKGQEAKAALDIKDFGKTYRALDGYGIEKLYAERESLEERGLTADDLLVPVEVVSRRAMGALIAGMDVVLSA
ncbi:MAG TPA: sulfurtransferase complex subunit TusC [Azospirillum sp.]|nr:sulfurtransferase complex subunit TusC [Azospirillum sp.]